VSTPRWSRNSLQSIEPCRKSVTARNKTTPMHRRTTISSPFLQAQLRSCYLGLRGQRSTFSQETEFRSVRRLVTPGKASLQPIPLLAVLNRGRRRSGDESGECHPPGLHCQNKKGDLRSHEPALMPEVGTRRQAMKAPCPRQRRK
jgi:hypothetical protein